MRIDKEKMNKLMALDDAALWAEIVRMAKGFGFNISENAPKSEDMQKIRSMLDADKINPYSAMKIIQSYKKDKGYGGWHTRYFKNYKAYYG